VTHRPRLLSALAAGAALASLAVLPGCIAVVAGAGAAGGYALGQERSPVETARDIGIRSEASQAWAKYNIDLAHDIDATVYEGRVLLTGRVPNEQWHQEAVKLTWQTEGVKEVYDEIEVGPDAGTMQSARDTVVSGRLNTELVADGGVRSINYKITTVNGVVYVLGSARSQAELDRVTDHARNLPNVRRVVSYVRIRPGEPPSQPVAASAPPPAPRSAPAPMAEPSTGGLSSRTPVGQPTYVPPAAATPEGAPTPRQSIEVTPLR
jgi:osmotically-inducible protein OsmY